MVVQEALARVMGHGEHSLPQLSYISIPRAKLKFGLSVGENLPEVFRHNLVHISIGMMLNNCLGRMSLFGVANCAKGEWHRVIISAVFFLELMWWISLRSCTSPASREI